VNDWLIIGIGNRLRRDDAVGPRVVDRLEKRGLQCQEHSGEGAGLISAWEAYPRVLLIDATRSDAKPGTIHQINAIEQTVPTDLFHYSSHQFGVAEAIEMARTLKRLPDQLWLVGIEGENFGYGEELTPQVNNVLDQAEQIILARIRA